MLLSYKIGRLENCKIGWKGQPEKELDEFVTEGGMPSYFNWHLSPSKKMTHWQGEYHL